MSQYSDLVLSNSPAMYWRLGVGGGDDQTANNRDGTGAGSITIGGFASLITDPDLSTDFDGSDDAITSTYDPFATGTSFSVSVWIRRDTSTTDDCIFGGTATTGPKLALFGGSDTMAWSPDFVGVADVTWASTGIADDTNFHIGFTFVEATLTSELFVNGVSKGTKVSLGTYNATSGNIQLGMVGATFLPFDGAIDEFAVFTSVLTQAQFAAHYQGGLGSFVVAGANLAPVIYGRGAC